MIYEFILIHGKLKTKNGYLRKLFWIDGNSHWVTVSLNDGHVTNSSNKNTNYAKLCKFQSFGILVYPALNFIRRCSKDWKNIQWQASVS
jgi:hypothetical protein